jgi:sterol desaturase/sphingolipid hydroxylase (fatty acid hydroxylase superfamily)
MTLSHPQKRRTLLTNLYLLTINSSFYLLYSILEPQEWNLGGFYSVLVGFFFLDLLSYLLHRLTHKLKFLWYIHELHHNSGIYHPTVAFRIHIVEMALVYTTKLTLLYLIKVSISIIIIYEVVALAWSLYLHSDCIKWTRLEKLLSLLFITRQLHKIHHNNNLLQQKKNYGSILSVWDRLFMTLDTLDYIDTDFKVGLEESDNEPHNNLPSPVLLRFILLHKVKLAKIDTI